MRYDGKILKFTKIALGGKVAYELVHHQQARDGIP